MYYRIYKFGKSISDDILNDWKPLVVITFLELFILIQLWTWYVIITKADILNSTPYIVIFCCVFALSALNYNYFLEKDKWKGHANAFLKLSKSEKIKRDALVVILMVLICFGLVYSIYRFSIIDWDKVTLDQILEKAHQRLKPA